MGRTSRANRSSCRRTSRMSGWIPTPLQMLKYWTPMSIQVPTERRRERRVERAEQRNGLGASRGVFGREKDATVASGLLVWRRLLYRQLPAGRRQPLRIELTAQLPTQNTVHRGQRRQALFHSRKRRMARRLQWEA